MRSDHKRDYPIGPRCTRLLNAIGAIKLRIERNIASGVPPEGSRKLRDAVSELVSVLYPEHVANLAKHRFTPVRVSGGRGRIGKKP